MQLEVVFMEMGGRLLQTNRKNDTLDALNLHYNDLQEK
jgi:hypothetical protein